MVIQLSITLFRNIEIKADEQKINYFKTLVLIRIQILSNFVLFFYFTFVLS